MDIKESLFSAPSESQADREVFYSFLSTVCACAGQDVSGVRGEQLSVHSDPPHEQTEDASLLLSFIYHSCLPWQGPWDRDSVVLGTNQFQKQCLSVGQPELVVGVLSLPTALWRQSAVPGAAGSFPLLRAGPARQG